MSSEFSLNSIIQESLIESERPTDRSYSMYHGVSSLWALESPNFHTDDDRSKIFLDFPEVTDDSTDDALSLKTSEVLFNRKTSGYDVIKLVHDFTFGCLVNTTDIPLSTEIPSDNIPMHKRDLLRKTPDYIYTVDETICLVEFGTISSSEKKRLQLQYDVKKGYYEVVMKDLESYHSKGYMVFVIIVGYDGVFTNLILPEELIKVLVYRFRVAKMVDDKLIMSGLKVKPIDEKRSASTKEFMQLLSSFPVEGMEEYSKEVYDRWVHGSINKAEVRNVIYHCWNKSIQQIEDRNIWKLQEIPNGRLNYSKENIAFEIANHMFDCDNLSPDGYNEHMKSIVNVPLVVLKTNIPNSRIRESKFIREDIDSKHSDEVLRLWSSAKNYILENDDFVDNSENFDAFDDFTNSMEDLMEKMKDLPTLGPKPSDTRSQYCRVKLEIPDNDAIELAKVGVQGKEYHTREDPSVKEYRQSKKKPYNLMFTDTSDFETFFESNLHWMIKPTMESNSRLMNDRIHLINKAMAIHDEEKLTPEYVFFMRKISLTPYAQWSSWISDIAFELCLALRQSCKRNWFIIKKLKFWECYLLIKPTRLSGKIFFSLLWFNDDVLEFKDYGNVFRSINSNGKVSWTDFVSLDQNKIENWALCESRTFAMIPYWLEFHGLEPFKLFENNDPDCNMELLHSSLQMMLLYTCIEIADKSEIEQEASLFRYMFMKSLTAEPLVPDPEVVIGNFKKQVRSRLTIWIQRKLIQYCFYVGQGRINIVQEDLDLKNDSISTTSTRRLAWRGLINPYNGMRLANPGDAVNLFYIGYVQNKNLSPEANVFSKMLEKILVLEDDFTEEIESRIGRENKPVDSGTKHEYNIDLLMSATDYAKNHYLPKLHGFDALSRKIEDVIGRIANTHIEDVFATLKASSNFSEKFFILTTDEYHRAKVIEKAQEYVHGSGTKVSDILKTCFNEVESNGYMRIDIFQKNQHGGIREIYVLGFAERVVQWVIETLSRALCDMFPGETMTHPENKKRLPEEHFKTSKSKFENKPTMTFATSADASKWSQNMYPHKFALMLCWLTPEYLHGFIWRSLSFWKNKYIMIPQTLIKRFHENDSMLFYNKYMSGLYRAYKGTSSERWANKEQAFIKVRTGMMQGILHYTSSLFHSIMNVYTEMLMIKKFSLATGTNLQPLIMQSSDDSCLILTCELPEEPRDRVVHLYAIALCQFFKANLGEEVSINNSSKKTAFHNQLVFEFNSAYHFGPSRYESDIKMLSSSLICTDRENMVDRHMEQYTQLTNFINAGGTIYSATFIQAAQALFNYRLMGSSVTCRFRLLQQTYMILPDPNLGFFLMDNPLFTGLCGYKYNLWMAIRTTHLGKTYKHYLNDALVPSDKNKKPDLITTKNGILAKRQVISFGNRMKLKAIMDRMSLPDDWQDQLDKDPSLFFRKAKNVGEFKILCSLKMASPGVQESLSTGNVTTRIMASSAYISISTVMRSLGEWQKKDDMDPNSFPSDSMYNLIQLMRHELSLLLRCFDELTEYEMDFLFPYNEEYKSLLSRLSVCDYHIPKRKIVDYRRVITDVKVFGRDNITAIPPDVIMSAIWFEDNDDVPKPNFPMKYIRRCYEDLRRAIPWLSDSLQETLDNGPFDHINGLAAWLSQFHQKDKIVVIIGAPIVCRRGSSSILSVIRQNFHKVYQLENLTVDNAVINSSEYINLKQSILLLMSWPCDQPNVERRMTTLLTSSLTSGLEYNSRAVKSRYNMLCIFKEALGDSVDVFSVLSKISESKLGIVGGYTIQQKFDSITRGYEGKGVWIGKFFDKKVQINVNSYYDSINDKHQTYIEEIFMEDIHPIDDMLYCLKTWCEENWVSDYDGRNQPGSGTRTVSIKYSRRAGLIGGVRTRYYRKKFCDDDKGAPVIVCKDIVDHLGEIKSFSLDIPVDENNMPRGVIKLMGLSDQYYRGKQIKLTLMRYIVNHRDYFGPTTGEVGVKLSVALTKWVLNQPLDHKDAKAIITRAINNEIRDGSVEHIRELLKNSFAKKGLKLGKKRDELPLLQRARDKYSTVAKENKIDIKDKVQIIPSAKEILEDVIEDGDDDADKPRKKLRWADEMDLDDERMYDSKEEEERLDKAFNLVDKKKAKENLKDLFVNRITGRFNKVRSFLGISTDGLTLREGMDLLTTIRAVDGKDVERIAFEEGIMIDEESDLGDIKEEASGEGATISRTDSQEGCIMEDDLVESISPLILSRESNASHSDSLKHESGEVANLMRLPSPPTQSENYSISSDEMIEQEELSYVEDTQDEDDDSIDWDTDQEGFDEICNQVKNNADEIKAAYERAYNATRIDLERDASNLIEVGSFHDDFDFEYFTSDEFFRDIEMINSSEFKFNMAMSETNVRNSLVKKEHNWFSIYVREWYTNYSADLIKLFHRRLVTRRLKESGFMSMMDFMFPGLTTEEEKLEVRFEMEETDDPFREDDA